MTRYGRDFPDFVRPKVPLFANWKQLQARQRLREVYRWLREQPPEVQTQAAQALSAMAALPQAEQWTRLADLLEQLPRQKPPETAGPPAAGTAA